ncbi:alkaline phosphatase [Parabacteroides sp. OttesenSCG-928-G06]|nr:alkaline phosphatase [Parabacteroides sp. OttesenSCG-928-K15]MDL2282785.1 alkaline phosphatase [Parabacteroides sp. OttesenSCG-928-G06]
MKRVIITFITLLIGGIAFSLSAQSWKAKHVVLIGLDGWGSYSVEKANMPHVKNLMENGCYTLKKRSVLPSSSAPNWASMFMGAGTELHGYTHWGSKTPELPSRELNKNGIFPTIFSLLKENHPESEIGCIFEWDGIKYLIDTLSVDYVKHVAEYNERPMAIVEYASEYIKEFRPNLLSIIIDEPDHVGHVEGHDTPAYYAKMNELDGYVGRIIQAIRDAGIWEETILIVTSDHGGIEKNHGGIKMEEMEAPFIIAGKNIRRTKEFSESMMQFDVAATIASIFNLEQPQVWIGRSMDQVFE